MFKHSGWIWQTEDCEATVNGVKGGGRISHPSGIGPEVNYLPPPKDVQGTTGLFADEFLNFPLQLT